MRALAFFIDGENWWEVKDRALGLLRQDPTVHARVRAGAVLPSGDDTTSVSYSEHRGSTGRRMLRHTRRAASGREAALLHRLIETVKIEAGSKPRPSDLLLSPYDCLSIGPLTPAQANSLIADEKLRSGARLLLQFDPNSAIHRLYLWDRLIFKAFVSDGRIYEEYEDTPEVFSDIENQVFFEVDTEYQREGRTDGYFWTFGDLVAYEHGLVPPPLPDDFPKLPLRIKELTARSPTVRVARSMPSDGPLRISAIDDGERPAVAAMPGPEKQFPDPSVVVRKVEDYCLSPRFDKHIGFAVAGYAKWRADDGYVLSSMLCSALLNEFPVLDPRVNADGSVQFSVPIALPKRLGGYARVLSSWYFTESHEPRLATAYVVDSDAFAEVAIPIALPRAGAGNHVDLAQEVVHNALEFSASHKADGMWAAGGLWIRHDHPASKAFAASLRAGPDSRARAGYTRRELGGPVTLWALGSGDTTEMEARLRYVQASLGMLGIRSHVELRID